jgi:hypothetical protein
VTIKPIWPIYSQNAPVLFKKKNSKKTKNGVAGHHLWGGSATPAYIYIFFWIFFFLDKKSARSILGINMPNGLNYHNLKVWGEGKVSHFKLWRQK